jgi:hypothetical protein
MSLASRAAAPLLVAFAMFAGCTTTVVDPGSTSSSSGTGTSSSSSGTGGSGCTPGALVACYTGPEGTENVGPCHGGAMTCNPDGMTFGACQWEVTPQKEDCATPADEDCDGATPPCQGATVWAESFGASGNEYGQVVAIDPSGDVIVVGGYDAAFSLGPAALPSFGQADIFVAKLDPMGKVIWAKGFGSTGNDYATGVAVDAQGDVVVTGSVAGNVDFGGGPLAGSGQDDIFLLKLDTTGKLVWAKVVGSAQEDQGYAVAIDAAGDIFTAGSFEGTIDLGGGTLTTAGSTDLYVARFSPAGQAVWTRSFGGVSSDYASGIGLDAMGNVLVAGGFLGPVDFGTGTLTTPGYFDAFVAKLDPTGKTTWVKQMKGGAGMGNYALPAGLAVESTGAVVVGGYFYGQVDFGGGPLISAGGTDAFLVRFDESGLFTYGKRYGSSYVYPGQPTYVTDGIFSVAVDASDDAVIVGSYIDTIDFGGGPLAKAPYGGGFLARIATMDEPISTRSYGNDVSYVACSGVAVRASGDAVVTGSFTGTVDFGKGDVSSPSTQDSDLFVFEALP